MSREAKTGTTTQAAPSASGKNNIPAVEGGTPVRETKIYYGHQYIDEDDVQAVAEVVRNCDLTCGPKIGELEEKLCRVTGAKYAVVCSNGTAALHMAAIAAGIKAGDEVITTPITFAASANCALYCGARPVFADIDPETYNIDPRRVAEAVTEKTKAVVAVDYTGQSAALDPLRDICREHNLVLIEDGAHVIGTKYKGRANGSISDMTTLSFHPVKTITGGEGGAVLTNDENFYRKLLLSRTHGITKDVSMMEHEPDGPWYYEQVALGYNYRLTDIQAALIISQLDKLSMFMRRRKEIVARYNEAFSKLPQLFVQREIPESDTTRHLYMLRIVPEKLTITRRQFFDALTAENVCCNVHYIPTYYFPYYEKLGYKRGICPNAEKLYEEIITLPLYYAMTDADVESVIEAVTKIAVYYGAE